MLLPFRDMIDQVIGRLERLPGTAVPWVIALGVAVAAGANLPAWLAGDRPVGTFVPHFVLPAFALAYFLGIIDVLDRIARSSFEEFRPALGVSDHERETLRAELTSIPDGAGFLAMLIFGAGLWAGFALDPANAPSLAGLGPTDRYVIIRLWVPVTVLAGLVAVHTVRQLRLVVRLHEMAAHVDPLDPGPNNAFSKLTAATAGAILVIAILFAFPESGQTSLLAIEIAGAIGFTALALASFVLPLRGMHGRLASEKDRLIAHANNRLRAVQARLHQSVDSDDLSRADEIQKTQAALLAERDLYIRLSTWPWSQGTFRGFASAVILPIALGVVLRILGRFV